MKQYLYQWNLLLMSGCSALLAAHAAPPAPTSAYTELAQCKTTDSSDRHHEPDANPDFFESTCPSFAGYQLQLNGSDARSWLVVKRGGWQWDTRNISAEHVTGFFPQIAGKVIEWRMRPGAKTPQALIVRLETQNEASLKNEQWLAVLRVQPQGVRVIGALKASGNPQANSQARDMADAAE